MNLADIMTEIGEVLNTVAGLRVYDYPPGNIQAPAAVVSYPDRIEYDVTYGRGVDRIRQLPIIILEGKAIDRSSRDRIARYTNGAGVSSVKALLESHAWVACEEIVVTECTFDVVTVAGVDYIAAILSLDVIGSGA